MEHTPDYFITHDSQIFGGADNELKEVDIKGFPNTLEGFIDRIEVTNGKGSAYTKLIKACYARLHSSNRFKKIEMGASFLVPGTDGHFFLPEFIVTTRKEQKRAVLQGRTALFLKQILQINVNPNEKARLTHLLHNTLQELKKTLLRKTVQAGEAYHIENSEESFRYLMNTYNQLKTHTNKEILLTISVTTLEGYLLLIGYHNLHPDKCEDSRKLRAEIILEVESQQDSNRRERIFEDFAQLLLR